MSDDPYGEATAEFYDLLATGHWDTFGPTLGRWLAGVDTGAGPILDVGAGTGVGLTHVLDALPAARIVAVEPSRAMRTALHTRLACTPALLDAVTVVPTTLADAVVPDRLAAALVLAVLGHLTDGERCGLWRLLAERLAPGAPAVVEVLPPIRPERVPPTRYRSRSIGRHVYEGWMEAEPVDERRVRWTMTYRVLDGERLVAERRASSVWTTHGPDDVAAEVASLGLTVEHPDDGHVILRR